MNIPILYEDDDFLAVNKPAGLLVHPAQPRIKGMADADKQDTASLFILPDFREETLTDWLLEKYPETKMVGDLSPDKEGQRIQRPGIVHRLDKDTSGVLVVAKNQKAFEYLKGQFKERKVKKKYIALARGIIQKDEGVIDFPIGKSGKDFRKKLADSQSEGKKRGKPKGVIREAVTEYNVLERFKGGDNGYTLVELIPKTGRTHQLRVHLKAIGHAVICDKLYGPEKKKSLFSLERQFLHAKRIEFHRPKGSTIVVEAPLPEDLEKCLTSLRGQN